MPAFATSGARFLAFRILQDIERTGALADETINRALAKVHIDPRDRALTVELVYGVLRHRGTLDWRLDHVSDRPMERLPLARRDRRGNIAFRACLSPVARQ